MKYITLIFLVIFMSCKNDTTSKEVVESSTTVKEEKVTTNRQFEIYDYDGLEPLINKKDDKVHVVNFWATWCAPCIKELPYFEAVNENYKDENVEVLLVSLDFPKDYDSKLQPYIDKHGLKSTVVAFDDTNQNRWIPAINENWSGAIPATIIYKGDKRQFYERSFTQEELETEIKRFL
ncbi:TlpA family protein disulfide reductase [Winogradskyella pulchriflava]|uniref:TlpA family protein disulfide reductase n=1 Tax=Winogradskyella pulchriflava TaxID=1110688 RepID=A0ABV6QFH2_9FLAO